MNRAGDATDIARAWRGVLNPVLAIVTADLEGRISHQIVGAAPRRDRGAGRLPAPGADSRWAWRGFISLGERLRRLDPAEGFVATANHDPFAEGDFPESAAVPGEFDPPWRVRRIRSELASRDDWDVGGFVGLLSDVRSELAVAMLKQLRPDLERQGGPSARQLLEWDARMTATDVEPLLFVRLIMILSAEIGGDEAAEHGIARSPVGATEILRLLVGAVDETWWDDLETPAVEGREEIVGRALRRLDSERLVRPWGLVHRVAFLHPMSSFPVVGRVVGRSWSRGSYAAPGDSSTVNAQYWSLAEPYTVFAIPSARMVCDVGSWDDTLLGLVPGQSGRPWSPHYDDQISSWRSVAPERFPFSDRAVEAAAVARLVLEPAGEP
jgi:penicillin amidase